MRTLSTTVGVLLLTLSLPVQAEDRPIDFQKDVAPIFAKRCASCHGEKREGGLRLTNRRDALTPGDSGLAAIEPGQPENSPLVERILSTDKEVQMPPEGERLTAAEVAVIQRWIKAGATWPEDSDNPAHWAYVKPLRPALPAVQDPQWPRNPVDYFLLQRMEQQRLRPAPQEGRARLLRRLHLALTGLPPTVEQVEAFLAEDSPAAYERAVDELLDSPRFGERWGQLWLDLARYADSNGFQADQLRDSWAYRDWLIDALNRDLPFDQFVIEQLAGDLLPEATPQQKIATGFHRTVTCNVEAGVHPEENRINQVFDRVNTTGLVFLGSTLECAQCHNHKYDPFPQQEYYQLFAYFNNTPLEVGNPTGVSFDFVGPKMELPLPAEQQAERNLLLKQQSDLQSRREHLLATALPAWEKELAASLPETAPWKTLAVNQVTSTGGETFEPQEDGSVLVTGKVPGTTTYTVQVRTDALRITALKLECLTHPELPGKGPGRGDKVRSNFILSEIGAKVGEQPVTFSQATADFSQQGWDVKQAVDGNLKTGWAISPQFGQPHHAVFQLQEPLTLNANETLTLELHQNFGQGRTIGCFRLSAFSGDPQRLGVPEEIAAIVARDQRSRKDNERLAAYFAETHGEMKSLDAETKKLKTRLETIRPATTLVMVELEQPRETSLLIRGDYLNPGKKVEPGTPSILHPLDPELPKNRLGLARWLTDRENPLLARVTVNRWWAAIWGQGIVTTPEDFGTQSDPPTHPELLDWLAVEFMEQGWSMKHVIKLMVMSNAFRQSSRITPELLERDPLNRLYARGPRFRMSAEMIRDNALKISGLLSDQTGGPPIMPYQPDGLWNTVGRNSPKWITETGADRFRRGVYVVWRRAAPYPSFVNFDAPDRAACVVERARTNTATQALTLLNDPAYLEMALSLAWHIQQNQPDASVPDKARYGFRRTLAREPNAEELAILTRLYEQERQRLQQSPQTARRLLAGIQGVPLPAVTDPVDLAAWLHVANVLLNLDETITRN